MGQSPERWPSVAPQRVDRVQKSALDDAAEFRLLRAAVVGVAATCGSLAAVRMGQAQQGLSDPELLWFGGLFVLTGTLALALHRIPQPVAVIATGVAPLIAAVAVVTQGGALAEAPALVILHVLVVGLLAPELAILPVAGLVVWLAAFALGITDGAGVGGRAARSGAVAVSTGAVGITALVLLAMSRRFRVGRFGALRAELASEEAERERGRGQLDALVLAQDEIKQREIAAQGDAMFQRVLETATDAMLLQDHERQQTINALVETSRDWIWATDVDGRLIFSNAAVTEILGHKPDEVLGATVFDFMCPDDSVTIRERKALWTSVRRGWRNQLVKWMHKSGQVRYLESSAVPILGIEGQFQGFRGMDRDVTERVDSDAERRRLEEQVRQGQKLEAIGALAGGVAHDFNNILQAILGTASLARLSGPRNGQWREDLTQIEVAAKRAADLTRQLLAFSRQQVLRRRVVDINRLTADLFSMMRRVIGEDISLEFVPGPAPARVLADPSQLEQVVLNLCVNARDALPAGGEIRIETAEVEVGAEFCSGHEGIVPGRFVKLSVVDNGSGMDALTQRRVFDPFFTTKGPGRGTGLGLSTVYGIVKQHGGAVEVQSEVGAGSMFVVYFPGSDQDPDDKGVVESADVPGGSETVLLAEDDEQARDVAIRLLGSGGYRVLVAEDGEVALQILREQGEAVDLLLLDVIMPKISGPEVERQAVTLAPKAKVIFATGYAASGRHDRFEEGQKFNVLTKPYGRRELLTKIREVLDHD